MWMVAIREHGYNGRRIPIGRAFKVLSEKDATVLRVARLARDAKKSEIPTASTSTPQPSSPQPQPQPRPEPQNRQLQPESQSVGLDLAEKVDISGIDILDDDDTIVYEQPRETVGETEESPEVKTRKQRRKYRRNDMVPE